LLLLGLSGCAAKSSYWLFQAESAVSDARNAGAPDRAVYHWTMADSFIHKAREEWGYSNFGAAETLARRAEQYAREAQEIAVKVGKTIDLNAVPEAVPEDVLDLLTNDMKPIIEMDERRGIQSREEDRVEDIFDLDDEEDEGEDSPW
jgi:hypothetical protein